MGQWDVGTEIVIELSSHVPRATVPLISRSNDKPVLKT